METMHYQGLFYLALGAGAFSTLLLGLRVLGDRMALSTDVVGSQEEKWLGLEELEIIEIIQESRDIKTFRFKRSANKRFPRFLPGQFISFQIGDDPKVSRSYSISSSPLNREVVQVAIKRLADGLGSGWFHGLKVGDRVKAHPPSGLFTDSELHDEERVFIAGGIGITPVLAMIVNNLERGKKCRMHLFYGMRTEQDLAFHDILQNLANRHQHFAYHPILSEPGSQWPGDKGFVTVDYILQKCNALAKDTPFFMCGPEIMMNAICEGLPAKGFDPDLIHLEKFASPTSFDRSQLQALSVQIRYDGQALSYKGKDTILEFLEAQNIHHPYACRVGVCGSCKCRVSGTVKQITDSGLTPQEKREGYVLSCVAFPLSDLEIKST